MKNETETFASKPRPSWVKKYLTFKNALALIFLAVFVYFLSDMVTADWMHGLVEWLGPFGPLGVILYVVISHILTPVAGSPGVLLSVGIYGVWQTLLYAYIGGLISSTIAFWISKTWGRALVRKLVGKDTMEDIDDFVDDSDEKILIFARLLGFPMFDIVSYAAGLTPIKFKDYFVITALVSAIPAFTVNYLVFNFADFSSKLNSYLIVTFFFVLGGVFLVVLKRYVKSYKEFKKKKEAEEKLESQNQM